MGVLIAFCEQVRPQLPDSPLVVANAHPFVTTPHCGFSQEALAREGRRRARPPRPERIVVLGGRSAVSGDVAAELGDWGEVQRLAGDDRFGSSAAVADHIAARSGDATDIVYVSTGLAYADALTAGAVAGADGASVLLVTSDVVPEATAAALERLDPARVMVMGGPAAVGDDGLTSRTGSSATKSAPRRSSLTGISAFDSLLADPLARRVAAAHSSGAYVQRFQSLRRYREQPPPRAGSAPTASGRRRQKSPPSLIPGLIERSTTNKLAHSAESRRLARSRRSASPKRRVRVHS